MDMIKRRSDRQPKKRLKACCKVFSNTLQRSINIIKRCIICRTGFVATLNGTLFACCVTSKKDISAFVLKLSYGTAVIVLSCTDPPLSSVMTQHANDNRYDKQLLARSGRNLCLRDEITMQREEKRKKRKATINSNSIHKVLQCEKKRLFLAPSCHSNQA